MNKYEKDLKKIDRQYDKDYKEEYESSDYGLWPMSDNIEHAFDKYIIRVIELLKMDLTYYDYLPEYVQENKQVINAYATIMNTNYINGKYGLWFENGLCRKEFLRQVNKCWSQYKQIQKEESKYPKKYLTYIPDEVETGIQKTR